MSEGCVSIKLPEEFLARMKHMLGKEYEAFVSSYEKERAQGLRFHAAKEKQKNCMSGIRRSLA